MSSTTLPRRSRLTPAARARPRVPIAVAGLAVAALVTGCRTTTTPSAAAFCRRVEANRSVLQGAGTDAAGVARTLAAYRNVAQVAPAGPGVRKGLESSGAIPNSLHVSAC